MSLTDEQKRVIAEPTKNILVSAGAGSGKTTVLTERIIHLLKDCHYSLSNMIILTFTNAAAKSMKDKIRESLEKEDSLKEELSQLEEAQIQTFDSFCHDFIVKYATYSDIPSSFQIGDNALFEMKKDQYIKEILKDYFNSPSADFLKLTDEFDNNTAAGIYAYFSDIYNKVINIYDHKAFLESYAETFFSFEYLKKYQDTILNIIQERIESTIDIDYHLILDSPKGDETRNYFEAVNHILDLNTLDDFLLLKNSTNFCFNISIRGVKDEELVEQIKAVQDAKKNVQAILDLLPYENIDEFNLHFYSYKGLAKIISQVLLRLDEMMNKYKYSHSVFTFLDIEKKTIDILKNNPEIRKVYKTNIKEILIDEYQDTNDIGNEIVSLISSDNVMVVGDVKQSIYRFRNANPKIFKDAYLSYKNGNGRVFDLQENFRSRKEEVIDPINKIFNNLMTEKITGLDYKTQRLIYGNHEYDLFKNELNNFNVLSLDEETNQYEAIASDIVKRMENGQMVLDKKTKKLREARLSDFLILSFNGTKFDDIAYVFDKYSLPTKIMAGDKKFTKSSEIIFVKNSLKLVYLLSRGETNDQEFNRALLSLLRSYVFRINDDLIQEYFDRNKYPSNDVAFKILFKEISEKYYYLAHYLVNTNYYMLVKELVKIFDVYKSLVLLDNIEQREVKLNQLIDKIKVYSSSNISFEEMISYFDYINKNDFDIEEERSSFDDLDCISLMTMHKSKGLEAPFVYITNLSNKLVNKEANFTKDFGFNYKNASCPQNIIMNQYEKIELRKEYIRVLYVALTRARESLTIMLEEKTMKSVHDLVKTNSFQDIILFNNEHLMQEAKMFSPEINKFNLKKPDNKARKEDYDYSKSLEKTLKKLIERKKASYDILDIESDIQAKLDAGTEVHASFERVSFISDIENEIKIKNIKEEYSNYLRNFKKQAIFNLFIIREFHELAYYLDDISGIMDYVLETEDKYIIVDFKMKNIDDPLYLEQLAKYKSYLSSRTNKNIETYLYSIINNELRRTS